MKSVLILILLIGSNLAIGQTVTWEQRYETCYYFGKTLKDEPAFTTTIYKNSGTFTHVEMVAIEDRCLQDNMSGIFKVESANPNTLTVYHLSGIQVLDLQVVFEDALGGPNLVTIGMSTSYTFP